MRTRSSRAIRGAIAIALALAIALAGCSSPQSVSSGSAFPAADTTRARSQALIENGNLAYERGDFALAARRYAAAAVVDGDDPAAYYGLGMALTKLGRDEQARTAYARARELTRQGLGNPTTP
ncbi:MAG: tetratricopeptide repeat protein [Candidatus Eisenbacteria bacterium]|uniref:Tetratricopeptide repeat protein n=1 Tax=Eiseniibacteriota bacterium TaxID=2212470 RepID=A0A849SMF5_UNCEI|nr:tetratricopeptide repeat protein [Candidatus Eisenbacteria bacterium]